jgi:hypothetical protein
MHNVNKELELYEPMKHWLEIYLRDKYKKQKCKICVEDTHSVTLDSVLERQGVINYYPQTVGIDIQIDVLGTVAFENRADLIFIEAKKTALNLHDLGQLWAYCRLCDPAESFLLSSGGIGSLEKILKNLHREDLLDYGEGKRIKKMQVAKWDVLRKTVDFSSIIPKL